MALRLSGRFKVTKARRYIQILPVLDFASLQPGEKATQAIRQAVADLALGSRYQARVRLTGPVAIQDEEFATLREGALPNTIGTVLVVLTILWLALKSPKIIFAVFVGIFAGLVITAALGLWLVGPLNPISIAFAVLFVGIGVDFGIQFSVRYRAERYEIDDLSTALVNTARNVGVPLTLAAATTAAGFFTFLPTAYGGFSALGEIAGIGMIVAYLTSITAASRAAEGAQPRARRSRSASARSRRSTISPSAIASPSWSSPRCWWSAGCRSCISCRSISTR